MILRTKKNAYSHQKGMSKSHKMQEWKRRISNILIFWHINLYYNLDKTNELNLRNWTLRPLINVWFYKICKVKILYCKHVIYTNFQRTCECFIAYFILFYINFTLCFEEKNFSLYTIYLSLTYVIVVSWIKRNVPRTSLWGRGEC